MTYAKLTSRGILRITGSDKEEFLQGLITNDIYKLGDGKALYACLLTPQGKYLYDFFLLKDGEALLMDCEEATLTDLQRKLRLHKLRSQVNIEEVPDLQVYACWPSAEKGVRDPRHNELGSRWLTEEERETSGTEEEFIHHCYTLGVPYHSRDLVPQKSILLESHMDQLNAIDWEKGCYMGQELTARTKYRGLVRKGLYPVKIEGKAPTFGAEIKVDGKLAGEMRGSSGNIGMALLREEALELEAPLICEESQLTVYIPV